MLARDRRSIDRSPAVPSSQAGRRTHAGVHADAASHWCEWCIYSPSPPALSLSNTIIFRLYYLLVIIVS